jgi:HSP20 family protein
MALKRSKKSKSRQPAAPEARPTPPAPVAAQPSRPAFFDPMREIARLRREMDRAFEGVGSPWRSPLGGSLLDRALPELDVYQEDDKVVVKAELPGVEKNDVNVQIDGDLLTVRGEKRKEEDVHDGDYTCKERSYGILSRSVRLPTDVDTEKATAAFQNGVLTMRLPKSEAAKRRSRNIKVQ